MIKDRQGHIVKELEGQNKLLKKLYSTSAVFTIFKDKYFFIY